MSRNAIETVMGGVVLVIAGGFLAFAYEMSDVRKGGGQGYHLKADFTNIGGINKGSDVRIGGVKVGTIEALSLVPESYQARAIMTLDSGIKIPADTSASISSDGLLGGKYIALQPGADEKMLGEGDALEYTQASVSIEELIGKFVFSGGGVDKGGDKGKDAAADPAAGAKAAPASSGAADPLSVP